MSAQPLIWIVDDSRTQCAVTEHALGPKYRFATYGDGPTVIEALRTVAKLPDLVLLDWIMPGPYGDAVCRQLRAEPRTHALPIILMTASRIETADIVCAIESGANDYVAKPFVVEELRARVTAVLDAAQRAEAERAATRYQQEMLGIVGHDLRNPISAMSMGIELLRDDPGLTDGGKRVLDRIGNSTRRMNAIVSQLLDVTRARLGAGIPYSPRATRLKAIVASVLDELTLSRRGVAFTLDGDDIQGEWDSDRLEQVISNLASNAAQYGRPGSTIRVELSSTDGHAVIAVRNQPVGAPMSPELIASLFDPFKRADVGSHPGLGLGLYIASEIVRAHHGTIEVESNPTETVFRVVLPLT